MRRRSNSKLKYIISKFKNSKILVIGDLMLDRFIVGEVNRICPEAPVPVVLVDSEYVSPGGAANIANNIKALGAKVLVSGIIGDDKNGVMLLDELRKKKIIYKGVFVDKLRPTTLKTRVMAQHQHIVRFDKEEIFDINKTIALKILAYVNKAISDIDSIVIGDYGKGVITKYFLKEMIRIAKRPKKIICVEPNENHFRYYGGITVIISNRRKAAVASKIKIVDNNSLERAGRILLKRTGCKAVLITLGKDGMCLFERSGKISYIPTVSQEVFDVSGAGDTVVSAFTQAILCGANMKEAAYISSYAANIVVGKLGISTVTKKELLKKIC